MIKSKQANYHLERLRLICHMGRMYQGHHGGGQVHRSTSKKTRFLAKHNSNIPGIRKNEYTFLKGMLRFPKFCRHNGNAPPSDAEVLAQQLQFEEISASQPTKKENVKSGVPGERGVDAKDVFEAARTAFFPKARVSVGPSYQNALGILPPPNQRGSPLNRSGDPSGRSSTQARGKEPAHGVYNSSPLRHVSGQPESTTSSPKGSNKAVHERQSFGGDKGETPDIGPRNPSA